MSKSENRIEQKELIPDLSNEISSFFEEIKELKETKETIFVGIPSYKDEELQKTIKSLINNAEDSSRLSVVVFCQGKHDIVQDEYKDHKNIIFISTNYKNAKGTGWARNKIQYFYNDEDYTLWIDAHMRFAKQWDTTLINMYKKLESDGLNPLITNYAAQYIKEQDMKSYNPKWSNKIDHTLGKDKFTFYCLNVWHGMAEIEGYFDDGDFITTKPGFTNVSLISHMDGKRILDFIDKNKNVEFIPSAWVSLHFLFTKGNFNKKIKFDPAHYFSGDEYNITLRAFTHGYDIVSPTKIVLYHWYKIDGVVRQNAEFMADNPSWPDYDEMGLQKNKQLFETPHPGCNEYGLGNKKTIDEFVKYVKNVSVDCEFKESFSVSEWKISVDLI